MRPLRLLTALLTATALGLALTGSAPAAVTNPFSVVPQTGAGQSTVTTGQAPTSTVASTGNGSFGAVDAIIIAVIVLGMIGGIAFFVWRNSRQAAAHLGREPSGLGPGEGRHQGSKAPHKQRKLSAAERKRRKRGRAPRRR